MGQINELIQKSHETARDKKFWDACLAFEQSDLDPQLKESILGQMYGNRLMHVVREIGEAWEELRKNGLTDDFREELSDAAIVLFDFCGKVGIDLETPLMAKMQKNTTRPDKHGKRF